MAQADRLGHIGEQAIVLGIMREEAHRELSLVSQANYWTQVTSVHDRRAVSASKATLVTGRSHPLFVH